MFPTPAEMRDHERRTLSTADSVAAALAEAGAGIARVLATHFPGPGTLWLVLGRGHNAADTLIAAKHLAAQGWQVRHQFVDPAREPAPAVTQALAALGPVTREFAFAAPDPTLPRPWLVLDGICGIGARLPLAGVYADAVRAVNEWRATHGALVAAIDLPSGLDGADGTLTTPCITADITIAIAAVKRGLPRSQAATGRLALLPLASLPPPDDLPAADDVLLTSDMIGPWLPPRPHDLHKGGAGRIALIAGSPGMTGAAALMALGALHGGAGLVTVFTPSECVAEVAARCPPEAMVRGLADTNLRALPWDGFDVIGIGPGCGRRYDAVLPALLRACPKPMVVDADALTGLACQCGERWPCFAGAPAARLLTPHPGEFARLVPELASQPRDMAARAFARRCPEATLLLKGAPTLVASADRPLAWNQTGHSGLASGGTGDVLAGLACALLHRCGDPWHAAAAAAWLHGRSAELTCTHGNASPESLLASTVATGLGAAFLSLRRRDA